MGAVGKDFRSRIEEVRERVDIVAVVGAAVKLRGGRNPRGRCPFHGSTSESLAVYPDRRAARCWGCGWSGDAISFVRDHYGIGFSEALQRLEQDCNLGGLTPSPPTREKPCRPGQRGQDAGPVDSRTMGRFVWRTARPDPPTVRRWFRARGVPETEMADPRLADIRFHAAAPIFAWPLRIGERGPIDCREPPRGVPTAPAIVALVRRPPADACEGGEWMPIGVHVTYLAPSLDAKMERRRNDGSLIDARKMLGRAAGGAVLLGRYAPDVPLYVGEGLETVLSGMAIDGAGASSVGLATLSLDNLQGHPLLWRKGVLPLFDVEPDPNRAAALAFPHDGPVSVLVDADMKPLRGPQGAGLPVVERRGGPIVTRAISRGERAEICAQLTVKAWRRAGARDVGALRPRLGMDFNDAVRSAA